MNDAGVDVSLFIAPDEKQIAAGARVGSQFIELHTGQFAEAFHEQERSSHSDNASLPELQRLVSGARQAHALGLRVNAGHGLNYENLPVLFSVPHLEELNIGHSIVSRSVFVGMKAAVAEMLLLMKQYKG